MKAKVNRIKLEEMLAGLVPTKEVGQTTTTLANGMKVVVKCGYNYRANCESIQQLFVEMDRDELTPPIETKTTRKLHVTGYEWYRANHPDIFKAMAENVIVTPAKVSVNVSDAEVAVE